MSKKQKYMIDFQDFIATVAKKSGIHDGIWGLAVEFRFATGHMGKTPDFSTIAVVGINKIGIQRFPEKSDKAFDVSTLNPALVRNGENLQPFINNMSFVSRLAISLGLSAQSYIISGNCRMRLNVNTTVTASFVLNPVM